MDSPPAHVLYDELPESPVQKVLYGDSILTSDLKDVSTPRRKTRTHKANQGVRRQKRLRRRSRSNEAIERSCNSQAEGPLGANSLTEDELLPYNFEGPYTWQCDSSQDVSQATPGHTMDSGTSSSYAAFVEAVLSDECSFYRLSRRVFVANGWNSLRKETYVSKTPLLLGSEIQLRRYLAYVVPYPEDLVDG